MHAVKDISKMAERPPIDGRSHHWNALTLLLQNCCFIDIKSRCKCVHQDDTVYLLSVSHEDMFAELANNRHENKKWALGNLIPDCTSCHATVASTGAGGSKG